MIRLLDFIDAVIGRFFKTVERSTNVNTQALSCFRIFFGLLLLLYFLPSWSWISEVPPAFYDPKTMSLAFFTENYLPKLFFIMADVLVILLALCLSLGFRTRASFTMLFLLFTLCYSYTYSFGKIDHLTTFLPFTCLVLAFTNSGTVFAIRPDKAISQSTQDKSIAFLGILIAFGFLTAGLSKLVNWIDFDMNTNGFLFWYYINYFDVIEHRLLMPYATKLPDIVLELLDYLAAVLEVSAFFFLFKGRRWWVFYLTLISLFHLANILLLNIDFTITILTYGIFIIAPLLSYAYERKKVFFNKNTKVIIATISIIAMLRIPLIFTEENPLNGWQRETVVTDFVNIVLWCFAILSGIFILKQQQTQVKTT